MHEGFAYANTNVSRQIITVTKPSNEFESNINNYEYDANGNITLIWTFRNIWKIPINCS